ncbi:MAG TPA: VCBS repeat-containing protein [Blastocatellia bacterium]|nr:VCBS repeat-containing protein [Blastocatellia bacterium]
MEKITGSEFPINEKKGWSAPSAGRLIVMALLVSAILSLSLPGQTRAATELGFNYRTATFSVGTSPSAAKIGDLDGDGLNDIAVVTLQGSLQLFFNNGAGSFQRVSLNGLWPSSSGTLDLDIGDMNADGRNDIAVAYSTQDGAVSVLLNQGNRVFSAPASYNTCSSSNGVTIGDLDRDGDNDLADISGCSRAGVLLNNGQGGFALSGSYGTGNASRSISLGDFNHDGFKDIAYVNNGIGINGHATVLFNNGDGSFSDPMWLYAGDLPDDLTVGDFDGDGNTDLAIANSYYSQVIVLLNSRDGSFPGYSEITGADAPTSIASADLNGDGRTDFAVTSWGTGRLTLLLNQGNYNFSGPTLSTGQSPVDVAAGRLDGDSLPDLVVVNQGSGSITVLFSQGGTSTTPPPPPAPQITLTVTTQTTRREKLVSLRWSGATSSTVDLYRNGSRIATVSNTGSYTDRFGSRTRGTFRYKVCQAGSQTCSNEQSVSF